MNSYGYGDHYVNVKVRVPTRLSPAQKALLTALAELETDTPGTVTGMTYTKDGKCVIVMIKCKVAHIGRMYGTIPFVHCK